MRIWQIKEKYRRGFTDDELVSDWLDMNDRWFVTPTNSFFGRREHFRQLAKYWLDYGEHGPDYNDHVIIRGQSYWDDFVAMHEIRPSKSTRKESGEGEG